MSIVVGTLYAVMRNGIKPQLRDVQRSGRDVFDLFETYGVQFEMVTWDGVSELPAVGATEIVVVCVFPLCSVKKAELYEKCVLKDMIAMRGSRVLGGTEDAPRWVPLTEDRTPGEQLIREYCRRKLRAPIPE